MRETKIEFLLKKILYYQMGGRQTLDKFNKWLEDEYEEDNKLSVPDVPNESEPQEDIEVAPLSIDEKNELAKYKLFKRLERYGFESITLSKCKVARIVADDTEGENFFTYLFNQKFGRIERGLTTKGIMSVKFIFTKEIRDKIYGEGKG